MSTSIEWTDETWNPVVGCTMVSPGCARCYAETMSNRLRGMAIKDQKDGKIPDRKSHYLNVINAGGKWTGAVELVPEALPDPFGWRASRRVFVNSMSDLFHKDVPFDFVDRVFAVMAMTPQHTYQILTKRPERMAQYIAGLDVDGDDIGGQDAGFRLGAAAGNLLDGKWVWDGGKRHRPRIERFISDTHNEPYVDPDEDDAFNDSASGDPSPVGWPLRNVWLGTSIENENVASERLQPLRAIKSLGWTTFVSYEPALTNVAWARHALFGTPPPSIEFANASDVAFDWLIVGGESGGGARPFEAQWARDAAEFCNRVGVPVFIKQMGSLPYASDWEGCSVPMRLRDKKGGDMAEWPEDLRIREFPTTAAAVP